MVQEGEGPVPYRTATQMARTNGPRRPLSGSGSGEGPMLGVWQLAQRPRMDRRNQRPLKKQ